MLTLADASSYMNRTPVSDPDTGRVLFYGQVDPYDDSKRDSATAYRRILAVAPGTAMPAGKTVKMLGQVWVLGAGEADGLHEVHREKFVAHQAPIKYKVSTLAEFLTGASTRASWAGVEWLKDAKEINTSSRSIPLHTLVAPVTADIREYDVVWTTDRALLISAPHIAPSGFLEATASDMVFGVVDAQLNPRVYDPVTGGYTLGTPLVVRCAHVRFQGLYLYESQASAKYRDGDASMVVPPTTTVSTSDQLVIGTSTWAVVSVETIGGAKVIHGRPA